MKAPKSVDTIVEYEVWLMQYALNALKMPVGTLDGIMGPITRKCISDAFKAHIDGNKAIPDTPIPEYARLAHSFIGVKEVPGKGSNPTILGWIKKQLGWGDDDSSIAWCAIFINEMLSLSGLKGTGKANAKSFLSWGKAVTPPVKGDIAVFDRGTEAWQGHVGIYWGDAEKGYVYILGGNQSNQVSIAKTSTSKLKGYRRLS